MATLELLFTRAMEVRVHSLSHIIMKLCCLHCDCMTYTAGKEWIKQVLVGASLFPATVSSTAFLMNLIAIYYHASRAIPFLTMVHTHASYSHVCVHSI